jgi:hypothetical protein
MSNPNGNPSKIENKKGIPEINQASCTNKKIELLTITINIDETHEQIMRMYDGDSPNQLAMQFCIQNKVDTKYAASIVEQISNNLAIINSQNTIHRPSTLKSNSPKQTQIKKPPPMKVKEECDDDIADENNEQKVTKSSPIQSAHVGYLGTSDNIQRKSPDNHNAYDPISGRISSLSKSAEKNRAIMLYETGMKSRQELQEHSAFEKRKASIKEMEGVTWRPDIAISNKVFTITRR